MRVLVCGGRDYSDWNRLSATLDVIHKETPGGIAVVIHGGARGADEMAQQWAWERGVAVLEFKADWSSGRSSGPMRNTRMLVEGKPDMGVAFQRANGTWGSGTSDMVRKLKAAGVAVLEVSGP